MKISQFIAISICTLFLFTMVGFAQPNECDGADNRRVTYRILTENVTERSSEKRIYLQIFIEQKRFTVDAMIRLIERIKCEYQEYDRIALSIFDNKKGQKLPDPPPHPLFELPSQNPPRGFFEFDKRSNTAEITFQEKRNDNIFDVQITFRSDGYCVSETPAQPVGSN